MHTKRRLLSAKLLAQSIVLCTVFSQTQFALAMEMGSAARTMPTIQRPTITTPQTFNAQSSLRSGQVQANYSHFFDRYVQTENLRTNPEQNQLNRWQNVDTVRTESLATSMPGATQPGNALQHTNQVQLQHEFLISKEANPSELGQSADKSDTSKSNASAKENTSLKSDHHEASDNSNNHNDNHNLPGNVKPGRYSSYETAGYSPKAQQQFTNTANKNWSQWTNGTGTMSMSQAQQLLTQNQKLTPEQEAVIATIANYMTNKMSGKNPGLTLKQALAVIGATKGGVRYYANAKQVYTLLEKDWSSWTDGASQISLRQIGELIHDPKVTGQQAAILSALAAYFYNVPQNTKNSYENSNPTQSLSNLKWLMTKQSNPSYISYYATALRQIVQDTKVATGGLKLYGPTGAPVPKEILQGDFWGDCYWISAVNGVLYKNPQLIQNMIVQNPNGTFTVTFPGGQTATVRLTDGEIGTLNIEPKNGCWFPVLSLAANKILSEHGQFQDEGQLYHLTTFGRLTNGGNPPFTFGLMNGVKYAGLSNPHMNGYTGQTSDKALFKDADWNAASIAAMIQQSQAQGLPVGISSTDHSLLIIGYNPATGDVTVKNPWGTSSWYQPENPSDWEVHMDKGFFTVPLKVLLRHFDQFVVPKSVLVAYNQSKNLHVDLAAQPSPRVYESSGGTTSQLAGNGATSTVQAPLNITGTTTAATTAAATTALNTNQNIAIAEVNQTMVRSKAADATKEAAIGNKESNESHEVTEYPVKQGSLLVMHNSPVILHDDNAEIHLASHAGVYVVKLAEEIGIYNLCDGKCGDVSVTIAGKNYAVPLGQALIVADGQKKNFADVTLSKCIETDEPKLEDTINGNNVFTGSFSYMTALSASPQFHQFLHSRRPEERAVVTRLLKTLAAITELRSNDAD